MSNEENQPVQATLSVDQRIGDVVIPRFDELEFFSKREGQSRIEARDLFTFAFALGFHNGLPIKLSSKKGGGFLRTEYISDRQKVLMRSVHYSRSHFEDADSLRDLHTTYALAEEYANGGFQILEGELDRNVGSEEMANTFIQEMDKLYEEYTGKSVGA